MTNEEALVDTEEVVVEGHQYAQDDERATDMSHWHSSAPETAYYAVMNSSR